jgi:hypothetical protein
MVLPVRLPPESESGAVYREFLGHSSDRLGKINLHFCGFILKFRRMPFRIIAPRHLIPSFPTLILLDRRPKRTRYLSPNAPGRGRVICANLSGPSLPYEGTEEGEGLGLCLCLCLGDEDDGDGESDGDGEGDGEGVGLGRGVDERTGIGVCAGEDDADGNGKADFGGLGEPDDDALGRGTAGVPGVVGSRRVLLPAQARLRRVDYRTMVGQ